MDIQNLKPIDFLPHRDEMLLVDKIVDTDYNSFIVTSRTVNKDDFYFKGHFPNHPIVPGIFIIEMMLQSCGILIRLNNRSKVNTSEKIKEGRAVSIKSAQFKKEVSPDSLIRIKAVKKFSIMNFVEFDVFAHVEENEVCKAELIISI